MFQLMRDRKYKREFRAAVVTYLGEATYLALNADERKHVDDEVSRMLASSFTPATAMQFFTDHWEVKAQTRARAMRRLGIRPLGGDLSWKDFLPLMLVLPESNLFFQFRPSSDATAHAERFLSERGVSVPSQHSGQRRLSSRGDR
jgi:hypothetical protein